jgi:hypothetical protein
MVVPGPDMLLCSFSTSLCHYRDSIEGGEPVSLGTRSPEIGLNSVDPITFGPLQAYNVFSLPPTGSFKVNIKSLYLTKSLLLIGR